MPAGSGPLRLKGGSLITKKKKAKKSKKKSEAAEAPTGREGRGGDEGGTAGTDAATIVENAGSLKHKPAVVSGTYEEAFAGEAMRLARPKPSGSAWTATYRAAPKVLHGYSVPVAGDTREEQLDIRCAQKADKFCK